MILKGKFPLPSFGIERQAPVRVAGVGDEIAGRRSGIVRRLEDGQWREAEAELVGHEVLGGRALIDRRQRNGQSRKTKTDW